MRNKMSLWKRSLAALLAFVMVLGMLPVFGMAPLAYAVEETDGSTTEDGTTTEGDSTTEEDSEAEQKPNIKSDYITLPITIRDFAADGMLFQYNENDESGIKRITEKTDNQGYSFYYNPTDWGIGGSLGFQVYDFHGSTTDGSWNSYPVIDENTAVYWHCVILDYYGDVLEVIPSGETKTTYDSFALKDYDGDESIKGKYDAWYSVWAWAGDGDTNNNDEAYNLLSQITADHKDIYRVGLDLTNYKLQVGNRIRINGDFGTTPGIRYFDSDDLTLSDDTTGRYWHCVICDSDGYVVKVLPKDTIKRGAYEAAMQDGYFSVWAWGGDGTDHSNEIAYNEIACITESNKACYQITFFGSAEGNSTGSDILYVDEIKTYHMASTRAFGLMLTNDYDHINNLALNDETKTISGSQVILNGSFGSSTVPDSVKISLNSGAKQTVYGALVRADLVGPELVDGKPIYTEATVTYLANLMQQIMAVPYQNADGSYNTYHVMGDKMFVRNNEGGFNYVDPSTPEAEYDLAEVLRLMVKNSNATDKLGTYAASHKKFTNGKPLLNVETGEVELDEDGNPIMVDALRTYEDVETWFDAAYFLLHNTWRDSTTDMKSNDGYGMPIPKYDRIHLIQTTNEEGQICYVFNAKYDGTTYDFQNGQIYNSDFGADANGIPYTTVTRPYTIAQDADGDDFYARGNPLPVNRFDPIGLSGSKQNEGYGMSGNLYGNLTGYKDTWETNYDTTNYNLSLEGHAQFVYHVDANQYFTFTGDDDVYLYINGVRVLDIGGAHAISKIRVNLNDVAETCEMKDGGTYRFDFFYMERHGTAANFGIETNIQIADASMNTFKTGYQGGVNTGYGGPVNKEIHVGYSFELHNDGVAEIHNLVFDDKDIGVYVGYDNIDLNEQIVDGKLLYDFSHLYLIYWDKNNAMEFHAPGTFDEEDLKGYLKKGLEPGERLGVYGFKYLIPEDKWVTTYVLDENGKPTTEVDEISFTNTVYTYANDSTEAGKGKQLHGLADWKVVQMEVPYTAFHVYDWVHKDVTQNPKVTPAWETHEKSGMPYTTDNPTNGVTVKWDKLKEYWADEIKKDATVKDKLENATIVLCTGSGNEDAHNQNPNVRTDGKNITYTSKTVGKDTVFFKYQGIADKYDDLVFSYEVFTYGAVDNVYVLDYGLKVELAGETFGFQNNDHLHLNENTRKMSNPVVLGIVDANGKDITTKEGTYGTFTWTEKDEEGNSLKSLKYEPTKIIDNTDSVYAKFRVMEQEAIDKGEEPSIYNSVVMVQEITTAPASVVYYEENFPGITYVNQGENEWVHYETVDDEGNSVAGDEQSADQNSNYGSDPNYGAPADDETNMDEYTGGDKVGTIVSGDSVGTVIGEYPFKLDTGDLAALQASGIEYLNEYLGLGGADSNGTVNELVVKQTAEVMYFEFMGTGFEIVARTTDEQYAVLNVQVQKKNADGTYTIVREKPVITESKGGDLYQVPVISIDGLDKATYRVVVQASGSTYNEETETGKIRVLYIDGIRIYGPLSDGEALEYYNPEEYQAKFLEVKELIKEGRAIYANASGTDNDPLLVTGQTLVEDTESGAVLTSITNPNQYMSVGPNNELYLDGNFGTGVLTFWLTPKADYPESARTLEIGAHRKADSSLEEFFGKDVAYLTYGSNAEDILDGKYQYSVNSGTEMYYTIDVKNLTYDEERGQYLVAIGTNGSETEIDILALTNIKVAGYDISFAESPVRKANDEGNVQDEPMVAMAFAFVRTRMATVEQEPEVEQIPVNENMKITSAKLKASTVTSGKTATLTVKADAAALTIVITDDDGNEITDARIARKVSNGVATFTVLWTVTGSRGDVQNYTIRVYDADEYASVNTETVKVTIN